MASARPSSAMGHRGNARASMAATAPVAATPRTERGSVPGGGATAPGGLVKLPTEADSALAGRPASRQRNGGRRLMVAPAAPRGGNVGESAFTKLVERTVDALRGGVVEGSYEDVRKILADIRKQYDDVHCEADKREAELGNIRREIRLIEAEGEVNVEEDSYNGLTREMALSRISEVCKEIEEAAEVRRVYQHMVERLNRELHIVQQKANIMEEHLARKTHEVEKRQDHSRRVHQEKVASINMLEWMEQDIEQERQMCTSALDDLEESMQHRRNEVQHREDFERWRYEIALEAANEAFQATAGRYRKIYAVEKLCGNALQKLTFEQAEHSQTTEDGFQKIREVTGLTDVMDIVHKFLNRDVEHEQLKSSVKEAEMRLETLREQFEKLKSSTDGMTFDPDPAGVARTIYLEVEEHEGKLNQVLKEHEQGRQRLQQSTLQVEHMKRWANRVGKALAQFGEDCVVVEKPADLPVFYQQMQRAVDKFIAHIVQQISSGKVQRKNMSQVASKEYHEARRLLADKDFLKVNCRVPASLDAGRPASRQGPGGTEEDSHDAHQQERERCKNESSQRISEATRKVEHSKKKLGSK
mmetsp:Transcript_23266/g.49536  ORF Transcript_23266/g.49536 Transcript_23266/m.49536 type:complete len:587 (+) Transcript_23266:151-1911(+)